MNKTAIKSFAIWARNKLITDISYKAGLLGITEKGIKSPLPQSTQTVQFFDIGIKEPSSITGIEIQQRKKLVEEIERKAKQNDHATAYKSVIEEVAYTWFNRLIAVRFMEVNDYLPTRIRVLSSESNGKSEPDLVTHALEANLDYSAFEKDRIIQLKNENKLDELFRMLFIKQCNALNSNLPELFEKTSDYTELLLNVSFTDKEGVVFHLVNDISEDDFNVSKEGQVEIIGWLYQYYNTEPKDETFALLKKNVKITKERIPAATQLFTPDWIVRYMVENSLGRLWLEGHPNDEMKLNWKYYLDEVEQEKDVEIQLCKIRDEYKTIKPEDIKVIDPAMGSGHILVYAFDVLMQIYDSYGYSQRDAAKSIVENNLYGLDIDNRAYQLAYFAVMMKARQFNRRVLEGNIKCHVYAIQDSNDIDRLHLRYFGTELSEIEYNTAKRQFENLLDQFHDAKEYGSIIQVDKYDWNLLYRFLNTTNVDGQLTIDSLGVDKTKLLLSRIVDIAKDMSQEYDVTITNPPYMGNGNMGPKLSNYAKLNYVSGRNDLFSIFIERCLIFTKKNRYLAMITQHQWMFLSSYSEIRKKVLSQTIINMAHLGARAFEEISGEVVQTTAFTVLKREIPPFNATYSRLVDFGSQTQKEEAYLSRLNIFNSSVIKYKSLPGNPIVYWISDGEKRLFEMPSADSVIDLREGIHTGKNEDFLRFWYEVDYSEIVFTATCTEDVDALGIWVPYNKGGSYRKWYGNNDLVIGFNEKYRNEMSKLSGHVRPSQSLYFKEGATWSALASGKFGLRYYPDGFLFDSKGQVAVGEKSIEIMALFNLRVYQELADMLMPTLDYKCGDVKKLPYCKVENVKFMELAEENIKIAKQEWNDYETSWGFKKHPLVSYKQSDNISTAFENWSISTTLRFQSMLNNERAMNVIFADEYEVDFDENELNSDTITLRQADLEKDVRSFVSYAVGCMFGRFNLNTEGIVCASTKIKIAENGTFILAKDNIIPITDEEYFKDDIIDRFINFVKIAYGSEALEANLDFISKALNSKGNSSREVIRSYFLKEFFKDHCQVYQKRPIYWLFDSGKQNGFKALVYMHRYDENTIGNLRIDYLHRMQRIYENEIARMQDTIENSKDAREVTASTKRKEKLIKQLQETKEYDEKIAHLALARTSIDLDDGVKVNYEKVQTDRDGKKLDVLAKI